MGAHFRVMDSPVRPPSTPAPYEGRRLPSPGAMTALAVGLGWLGIWLSWQQRWEGILCAAGAVVLAAAAVWHGRALGRGRNVSLRLALAEAQGGVRIPPYVDTPRSVHQ